MKKLSSILFVLVMTAISCFGQIRFEAESLEAGEYEVYMYISAPNDEKQCKGERGWKLIGRYIQRQNGPWKYNYKSAEEGDVAGALLLVKTK